MHPAPSRGDQEIDSSIEVDIAHPDRIKAKGISGGATGIALNQRKANPSGKQVSLSGRARRFRVLPGANDEIVMTVTIHVASRRRGGPKPIPRVFTSQSEQPLAILPAIDIDSARIRPFRTVLPVGTT